MFSPSRGNRNLAHQPHQPHSEPCDDDGGPVITARSMSPSARVRAGFRFPESVRVEVRGGRLSVTTAADRLDAGTLRALGRADASPTPSATPDTAERDHGPKAPTLDAFEAHSPHDAENGASLADAAKCAFPGSAAAPLSPPTVPAQPRLDGIGLESAEGASTATVARTVATRGAP